MMVKLFSLIMSGLILIQSFDIAFSDIAQFDDLLEHAQFHAEEYGDDLFVFISKHYGELKEQHNEDHREEKKDHEKLPFQNHCCFTVTVAIVSDSHVVPFNSFQNSDDSSANFYYCAPISSLHEKGLFQPPRFV